MVTPPLFTLLYCLLGGSERSCEPATTKCFNCKIPNIIPRVIHHDVISCLLCPPGKGNCTQTNPVLLSGPCYAVMGTSVAVMKPNKRADSAKSSPVSIPHRLLSWISRMISWFPSYQLALGCHWKARWHCCNMKQPISRQTMTENSYQRRWWSTDEGQRRKDA